MQPTGERPGTPHWRMLSFQSRGQPEPGPVSGSLRGFREAGEDLCQEAGGKGGEFNRAGSTATGHGLIGVRQCMQSRNLVLRGCCLCCLSPLQTSKPRTSKNCCRHHSPSALMACCVLGQDRWEQPAVGFEPGDPLQISR